MQKSNQQPKPTPNCPKFFRRENLFSPLFLFLYFAIFIAIILTISLVIMLIQGPGEVTITNEPTNISSAISDSDLSRVKTELFTTLNNLTDEASNYLDVSVRWDSVEKTSDRTTFVIDVDSHQQTYLVTLDPYHVTLSCPDPSVTKYPDSFCVGNDGEYNDSISVIFGEELPLTAKTSAGDTFEIVRSEISGGEWNRDLAIWIFSCPASDAQTTRVSAAVDDLISARGGSPSAFTKKFYHASCAGE